MTCKAVRKVTAMVAVAAWVAAVGTVVFVDPHPQRDGYLLLMVCVACASAICSGVGYLLANGSAEKVWELGYEAGYKAASAELYEWPPQEAGKVTRLATYRG